MQKRLMKLELYVNYILIKLGEKLGKFDNSGQKKTKSAWSIYTKNLKYTKYSIKDSDSNYYFKLLLLLLINP